MNLKNIATSFILVTSLSACVTVDEPITSKSSTSTETPLKAENTKVDPDKKICKSQPVTGSRFSKKICQTQAQWDAIRENAKKTSDDLVNQTTVNSGDLPNN